MEVINVENDITVYYVEATSFPEHVLEAHETLHAIIPFSNERRYFGLSRPEKGIIGYKAAAEVMATDHEKDIKCQTMIIKKGSYRCITVSDYMNDIESIGAAFKQLISFQDIDPDGYCVEWYIDDSDVKCMVRLENSCKREACAVAISGKKIDIAGEVKH
ncbi:hypothetical protein SAMN06296020_11353 [Anoxynatronum buryatiense]|uniref:Uncharacterized protein n=2 Tax=Anoxynatronum buryatiense TaxID=489973 RepID=A0AA45WXZ3_9CLOT|nr:hypothetical protein SAMN06296020_11353 [Anoxynatronum buryatiense]